MCQNSGNNKATAILISRFLQSGLIYLTITVGLQCHQESFCAMQTLVMSQCKSLYSFLIASFSVTSLYSLRLHSHCEGNDNLAMLYKHVQYHSLSVCTHCGGQHRPASNYRGIPMGTPHSGKQKTVVQITT